MPLIEVSTAMHAPVTDQQITELLPRCQQRESVAIEALYDLYSDRLYRYILARTGDPDGAADLTTEVFLRVIQRIDRFRLNRQRPAASFSAWIYRIAGNLVNDHYRVASKHSEVQLDEALSLPAETADPGHVVERKEAIAEIAQVMEQLSEDQRLVLVGKFGEEMSNAEVAAWLGKSEGAVKSLQHRALSRLSRLLAHQDE